MLVTFGVSDEKIMDLISLALEGGSNYWYSNVDAGDPPTVDFPISYMDYDWWQTWPMMDGSTKITECDTEDGKLTVHILDKKKIQDGLALMAANHAWHFANVISGDTDIETGDVFLQYCLFGEIVYG